MPTWYLYIIRCSDNSLYTGIATNVGRRFAEHQGKGGKGAKYLRGRMPLTLVYAETAGTRSEALTLECRVKKMSKKVKEKLVAEKKNYLHKGVYFSKSIQSVPGRAGGIVPFL
jgi:putative endonuclease